MLLFIVLEYKGVKSQGSLETEENKINLRSDIIIFTISTLNDD